MTIKKTVKSAPEMVSVGVPAPGGATIADRFKLDMPDPSAKKSSGGPAATAAAIVGFVALGAVGVLTYLLYQHWEYLMPA